MASVKRVYDWGDKSSKLLYWLAMHVLVSRVILAIVTSQGGMVTGASNMAEVFADYYQFLYAQWGRLPMEVDRPYYSLTSHSPDLLQLARDALDRPIELAKIESARYALRQNPRT